MRITESGLKGLLIIEPDIYRDQRGYFMETWNHERYSSYGINDQFVQDNLSFSACGILRGLHFQNPRGQGKLVYVTLGEVFDVAVDIRAGSPTYGRWEGYYLSAENSRQLYIPEGFAHGFCVTSKDAVFVYKCNEYYSPSKEAGILWSDPEIGIKWPVEKPVLSEKDAKNPLLRDLNSSVIPRYGDSNEQS